MNTHTILIISMNVHVPNFIYLPKKKNNQNKQKMKIKSNIIN